MDKRYQVFVSSTYADLKEERKRVIQTLIEMDCLPSGMELFPAADEEQWEFIKRVIDDCDYYLLIIGGRYGSVTSEGISYTEKEYDYACERGIKIKVIALLHERPDEISVAKSEIDPNLRNQLELFREKVSKHRLVKFWQSPSELPGLVALSLSKTIKTYPAVGWVRADKTASTELLNEINELRKRNEDMSRDLAQVAQEKTPLVPHIAPLNGTFKSHVKFKQTHTNNSEYGWVTIATWEDIFSSIAPYLLEHPNDGYVKHVMGEYLFSRNAKVGTFSSLDAQDFQTIKVQLLALGLVNVDYSQTVQGGMDLFWSLTRTGRESMLSIRSIKSDACGKN